MVRRSHLVGLILALCVAAAQAVTRDVTCSGSITSALQSAINASADDDIVNISSGSCSAGTVSWSNKNITVRGQGIGVTTISGVVFDVTTTTKANFRITGFGGAAAGWQVDGNNRTTGIKGWRIDHVSWSFGGCTQNIAIQVYGLTWGLIDNNVFSGAGNAIFITAWAEGTDEVNPWPPDGTPGMGGYSWLLDSPMGNDEAVYVEDNTFSMPTGCYYGVGDMYYGGRMVFRFNSVLNAYWQNHSARSYERGGNVKAEIYHNDFNATDSEWYRAIHIRSGTGIVFNNSLRTNFDTMEVDNQRSNGQNVSSPFGACNGSSSWDENRSGQSGYPCLDQIGRKSGANAFPGQDFAPIYVFRNGTTTSCSQLAAGGSCSSTIGMAGDGDAKVVDGRDYYNVAGSSIQTSASSPFNGTSGIGFGTLANRPATCTTSSEAGGGVAYWAIDQGNWNGIVGAAQGVLYRCSATNTWTHHYTPFTYPHPTRVRGGPAAPTVN